MKIDVFCHIMPPKYEESLRKKSPGSGPTLNFPALANLDLRFRVMDAYPDYRQVPSVIAPIAEAVAGPDQSPELCRLANDTLAELVSRYPDRFIAGIAVLPMNNMEAALRETERAIKELGFRGLLLRSSINGKPLDAPEFMPLYEMMARFDLPIWLHPRREAVSDYPGEQGSKFWAFSLWGWPYETTVAMTRLVFSGVFDRWPNLKIITHHAGAMVPFFEKRITSMYGATSASGRPFGENLKRPILDYFRMFYNDTAVNGSTAALMCAHSFFGADRLLFGTDAPMDADLGDSSIGDTIRSVEGMTIPQAEKEKIFEGNARKLLWL